MSREVKVRYIGGPMDGDDMILLVPDGEQLACVKLDVGVRRSVAYKATDPPDIGSDFERVHTHPMTFIGYVPR